MMAERVWTEYRLAKESDPSHFTDINMFKRNNALTLLALEAVCTVFGITLTQFFTEGNSLGLTDEQQIQFAQRSSLTDQQKNLLLEMDIM